MLHSFDIYFNPGLAGSTAEFCLSHCLSLSIIDSFQLGYKAPYFPWPCLICSVRGIPFLQKTWARLNIWHSVAIVYLLPSRYTKPKLEKKSPENGESEQKADEVGGQNFSFVRTPATYNFIILLLCLEWRAKKLLIHSAYIYSDVHFCHSYIN